MFGDALHAVVSDAATATVALNGFLAQQGFAVQSIKQVTPSMEDVFVSLIELEDRQREEVGQDERDRARQAAIDSQIQARKTAENWTEALVNINRRIVLHHVDEILVDIVTAIRKLLQVDFVGLGIQNQESQLLELKCYANTEEALLIGADPPVVGNPLIRNTMDTAISYYSESQESDGQLDGAVFHTDQRTKAMAVVAAMGTELPLYMRGEP